MIFQIGEFFYPLLICYIIIKTQKNIIIRAAGEDYQLLPFHLEQKQVRAHAVCLMIHKLLENIITENRNRTRVRGTGQS